MRSQEKRFVTSTGLLGTVPLIVHHEMIILDITDAMTQQETRFVTIIGTVATAQYFVPQEMIQWAIISVMIQGIKFA